MENSNNTNILKQEYFEAIQEAQILLSYVSQKGVDVPEDIITIIVKTTKEEEWTPEIEIKFWMAFKNLSNLAKPVSVDSLKAIKKPIERNNSIFSKVFKNRTPQSSAASAVRFYKFMILVTIFLLLFVQVYWMIGSKVRANIKSLEKELDNPNPLSEIRKVEIGAQMTADMEILQSWNKVWKYVTFSSSKLSDGNAGAASSTEYLQESQKIMFVTEFPLIIIQNYLLPLLFGLLGALTYVIRSLLREIRDLLFTNESRINYGMRILLGMLAGFTITWFFPYSEETSKTFSLNTLSPMALSFLAGYSVELLFSAMDNIIGAFTKKKSEDSLAES